MRSTRHASVRDSSARTLWLCPRACARQCERCPASSATPMPVRSTCRTNETFPGTTLDVSDVNETFPGTMEGLCLGTLVYCARCLRGIFPRVHRTWARCEPPLSAYRSSRPNDRSPGSSLSEPEVAQSCPLDSHFTAHVAALPCGLGDAGSEWIDLRYPD